MATEISIPNQIQEHSQKVEKMTTLKSLVESSAKRLVVKLALKALSYRVDKYKRDQKFLRAKSGMPEATQADKERSILQFLEDSNLVDIRILRPKTMEVDEESYKIARAKIADILKRHHNRIIFLSTHTTNTLTGAVTLPRLLPRECYIKIFSRPLPMLLDRLATNLLNGIEIHVTPRNIFIWAVKKAFHIEAGDKKISISAKEKNKGFGSVDLVGLKYFFYKEHPRAAKAFLIFEQQGTAGTEVAVNVLGNPEAWGARAVAYLKYGKILQAPVVPIIFTEDEGRVHVEVGDEINFPGDTQISFNEARNQLNLVEIFFGGVLSRYPGSTIGDNINRAPNIIESDPNRDLVETAPRIGLLAVSYALRTFTRKWNR